MKDPTASSSTGASVPAPRTSRRDETPDASASTPVVLPLVTSDEEQQSEAETLPYGEDDDLYVDEHQDEWVNLTATEKTLSNTSSFSYFCYPDKLMGSSLASMAYAAIPPWKRKKARAEATQTDLRRYVKQFSEAKTDEVKSWFENDCAITSGGCPSADTKLARRPCPIK